MSLKIIIYGVFNKSKEETICKKSCTMLKCVTPPATKCRVEINEPNRLNYPNPGRW